MRENQNTIVPSNYNDYIYKLTYQFLAPLVPYIPRKITPNQITIAGFFCALIGTGLLYFISTPIAYIDWVIFNLLWFFLDALDGMHARSSNQGSEYGAFLDHTLDNIYFIFMLTVFAAKFDLLHLLYLYIIILRVTASAVVFIVQAHTKKVYLSRVSGGFETLLFSIAMILSYCYPTMNPAMLTTDPFLLKWIFLLDLQKGFFLKCALFPYFIGIPITFFLQFRFVKKELMQSPR